MVALWEITTGQWGIKKIPFEVVYGWFGFQRVWDKLEPQGRARGFFPNILCLPA
jgi:hypothetical protein